MAKETQDELDFFYADDLPTSCPECGSDKHNENQSFEMSNQCCPGKGFKINSFHQIDAIGLCCAGCDEPQILMKLARKPTKLKKIK